MFRKWDERPLKLLVVSLDFVLVCCSRSIRITGMQAADAFPVSVGGQESYGGAKDATR